VTRVGSAPGDQERAGSGDDVGQATRADPERVFGSHEDLRAAPVDPHGSTVAGPGCAAKSRLSGSTRHSCSTSATRGADHRDLTGARTVAFCHDAGMWPANGRSRNGGYPGGLDHGARAHRSRRARRGAESLVGTDGLQELEGRLRLRLSGLWRTCTTSSTHGTNSGSASIRGGTAYPISERSGRLRRQPARQEHTMMALLAGGGN